MRYWPQPRGPMKSTKIALSTILLSLNAQAEISIVLSPGEQVQGINYPKAIELLNEVYRVEYGVPIEVKVNEETRTFDISDFDGRTIRVPIELAASQPNKTDPTSK